MFPRVEGGGYFGLLGSSANTCRYRYPRRSPALIYIRVTLLWRAIRANGCLYLGVLTEGREYGRYAEADDNFHFALGNR